MWARFFMALGTVKNGRLNALQQRPLHLPVVAGLSPVTPTLSPPIEIPFQPEMKPIPGLSAPISAQLGAG